MAGKNRDGAGLTKAGVPPYSRRAQANHRTKACAGSARRPASPGQPGGFRQPCIACVIISGGAGFSFQTIHPTISEPKDHEFQQEHPQQRR